MKRNIDLMPPAYRRSLGVQRLRSIYLKIGLVLAVMCGGLFVHGRHVMRVRQSKARVLAAQVAELEDIRARAKARNRVADDLQSRLDDYNNLALPIEPSEVVTMIGAALHPQLVLTELKMNVINRRRTTSALDRLHSSAQGKKKTAEKVNRVLSVEISGLGAEGVYVAQLIGRLEINPAFEGVQLEYDRIKTIDNVPLREFCVRLDIDLEADFERRVIPVVRESGTSVTQAPEIGTSVTQAPTGGDGP